VPFVWTATAEQILEKARRGRVALEAITNQNRDDALVRLAARRFSIS
jgi:hypothetical protein